VSAVSDTPNDIPNAIRFSGFADLYDANRPTPPTALGPILRSYADVETPSVVDLGSGTGLSTRWARTWASSVVGVEPSDDMRAQAESRAADGVSYRSGTSTMTGLADGCADVVLAVQAMHWMEPTSTMAEVARLLRPHGVFATVDADWPPVAGVAEAEQAWATLHRRMRVFEARRAQGVDGAALRASIDDNDPALIDEDLRNTHHNRSMPGGVRSWSKDGHLETIASSGLFAFSRELVFDEEMPGGADAFIALMRSQGSYQGLVRAGLTDAELGADAFESSVHSGYARSTPPTTLSFSWRVRLGVR
jgi:SAM-dependent methyltransferase